MQLLGTKRPYPLQISGAILILQAFLCIPMANAQENLVMPYVLKCTDVTFVTTDFYARLAPILKNDIEECKKNPARLSIEDPNAIHAILVRNNAGNRGPWPNEFERYERALESATSSNATMLSKYREKLPLPPEYISLIVGAKDVATRVKTYHDAIYSYYGGGSGIDAHKALLLNAKFAQIGQAYTPEKDVVFSCLDYAQVIDGKPLRNAMAIDPLMQPCYSNPDLVLHLPAAEAHARLDSTLRSGGIDPNVLLVYSIGNIRVISTAAAQIQAVQHNDAVNAANDQLKKDQALAAEKAQQEQERMAAAQKEREKREAASNTDPSRSVQEPTGTSGQMAENTKTSGKPISDDIAYARAKNLFNQFKSNYRLGSGTTEIMWSLKKAAWKGFSNSESDGLDPYAHEYLGRAFYLAGDQQQSSKEFQIAAGLYLSAAQRGVAAAQTRLGILYGPENGSLPRELAKYRFWLEKAAEQNYSEAEEILGESYRDGIGVSKDPTKALSWFQKAASRGDGQSEMALGAAYANGEGTPKDDVSAIKWIRKSAEDGNANGQRNLGILYRDGMMGIAKDEGQSMMWLRKAAEQGDSDAISLLRASLPVPAKSQEEQQLESGAEIYAKQIEQNSDSRCTGIAQLIRNNIALGHMQSEAALKNMGKLLNSAKQVGCM